MGYNVNVTPDAARLLEELLKLPETERARVVGELLRSLDSIEEPLEQADYDASWGVEIERRVREVESGAVVAIPWDEARRRISGEE